MKKAIFGVAFFSMMCAGRAFSVDVMVHDSMKDPVIHTAPASVEVRTHETMNDPDIIKTSPATVDPKLEQKVLIIDRTNTLNDDGVKTLDNFNEPTDFVAPVDAE